MSDRTMDLIFAALYEVRNKYEELKAAYNLAGMNEESSEVTSIIAAYDRAITEVVDKISTGEIL